jgi:hypothetical protein
MYATNFKRILVCRTTETTLTHAKVYSHLTDLYKQRAIVHQQIGRRTNILVNASMARQLLIADISKSNNPAGYSQLTKDLITIVR